VLLAKLKSLENTTQKKTAYKMLKIPPVETEKHAGKCRESEELDLSQRRLAKNLINIPVARKGFARAAGRSVSPRLTHLLIVLFDDCLVAFNVAELLDTALENKLSSVWTEFIYQFRVLTE